MKTSLYRNAVRGVLCSLLPLLALLFTELPVAAARGGQSAAGVAPLSGPDVASIDAFVSSQMRANRIPGLSLGIVHGTQMVHLQGFGAADATGRMITPQTPFLIGSMSKSFTALAVMQLVEAGKVALDTPVQRYLPWFRVADPTASARITVRQLLHQTSGIPANSEHELKEEFLSTGNETLEQYVRGLKTLVLDRPVGASFEYANTNYSVLGLIVQTVSGQSYETYMQQHLIAQLNGGRFENTAVLSAAGIATLHAPAAVMVPGTSYGMGWVNGPINGVPTIWHNGSTGNFYSDMILVPQSQWGIVVLSNESGLPALLTGSVEAIAAGVMNMLVGQKPAPAGPGVGTIYLILDSSPRAHLGPGAVVDTALATLVRAVWATVAAARPFEARLHYRADWLAAGVGTDPSCTLTWTADSERLPHLAYAVFQRARYGLVAAGDLRTLAHHSYHQAGADCACAHRGTPPERRKRRAIRACPKELSSAGTCAHPFHLCGYQYSQYECNQSDKQQQMFRYISITARILDNCADASNAEYCDQNETIHDGEGTREPEQRYDGGKRQPGCEQPVEHRELEQG